MIFSHDHVTVTKHLVTVTVTVTKVFPKLVTVTVTVTKVFPKLVTVTVTVTDFFFEISYGHVYGHNHDVSSKYL